MSSDFSRFGLIRKLFQKERVLIILNVYFKKSNKVNLTRPSEKLIKNAEKAPEGVSLHILAGVMFLIDKSFQISRLSVILAIISWACAFDVLQKNLEDHLEKSKYRSQVQRFSFQMIFLRIADVLR